MKKALPFIFLLLTYACVFAQPNAPITNKLVVKIAPLSFADIYGGPSWRAGIEYMPGKNWAIAVDGGSFLNYRKHDTYIAKTDIKGFYIRPEVKLYFNRQSWWDPKVREYLACEYLYRKTDFNFTDSIRMQPSPPSNAYEKTYRIFKDINAITLKYGFVKNLTPRFLFEFYTGAGVRFVKGHNTLTPEENNHILTGENHGPMIGEAIRSYEGTTLNLALGFHLGYRIL